MEIINEIVDLILKANPVQAKITMQNWADQYGPEFLVSQVLLPVLDKFTADYFNDRSSPLARAYVAAKVAEDAMEIALKKRTEGAPPPVYKGCVVIGNIEDDFHALGRRIVTAFLRAEGWKVVDIGNDVPAEDFITAAKEHNADIIAISAMMYSTAKNIIRVREILNKENLQNRFKLAVGGAIFNIRHELVAECGGDCTAQSALEVSAVFEKLLKEAGVCHAEC